MNTHLFLKKCLLGGIGLSWYNSLYEFAIYNYRSCSASLTHSAKLGKHNEKFFGGEARGAHLSGFSPLYWDIIHWVQYTSRGRNIPLWTFQISGKCHSSIPSHINLVLYHLPKSFFKESHPNTNFTLGKLSITASFYKYRQSHMSENGNKRYKWNQYKKYHYSLLTEQTKWLDLLTISTMPHSRGEIHWTQLLHTL